MDVAQDYALQYLDRHEVFERASSGREEHLPKVRAGNAGRFSTDPDFSTPDIDTAELVLDTLDGATIEGVTFAVTNRTPLRRTLEIDTTLGRPDIPARIEISPRPLWLPNDVLEPVRLPVHDGFEFQLAALPAPALEESLAEKLAAWRKRRKIHFLYYLYWFGRSALNKAPVRRVLASRRRGRRTRNHTVRVCSSRTSMPRRPT